MRSESVEQNITVQSSNVDLGEALPQHVRESIQRVGGKYFGQLSTASVQFTREGTGYRCLVSIRMGALPAKSAEAEEKDIHVAFRAALDKVAKQLRRFKREVREDKGERVDKDMVLREGMHLAPKRGVTAAADDSE